MGNVHCIHRNNENVDHKFHNIFILDLFENLSNKNINSNCLNSSAIAIFG